MSGFGPYARARRSFSSRSASDRREGVKRSNDPGSEFDAEGDPSTIATYTRPTMHRTVNAGRSRLHAERPSSDSADRFCLTESGALPRLEPNWDPHRALVELLAHCRVADDGELGRSLHMAVGRDAGAALA